MSVNKISRFLLLGACFLGSNSLAWAAGSGAFRVETPDAGAFGKGSAFVGEANTPAAVYYNPAGINQIKSTELSFGTAFLAPAVDYQPASGNTVQMRRGKFFIPHVYAVAPITKKLSLGLGATSYFGLATEWAEDSPLRYDATKSEIMNQNYMLTASYQVTDQWSFAAGPDSDLSNVSKNKKLAQANGVDGNLQVKVDDVAWGYRLASMFKVNEKHQFGLMYRSRFNHTYEGKAYLDGLNSSATLAGMGLSSNSYQGVFGGTTYETRAVEKFTLPQSVVLGYSFKPTSKWTINIDVEWMDWSSVKQEVLDFPDETDASRRAILTASNPIRHDWNDVWSQAIGVEYAVNERLRLRGGYYHHDSPIPVGTWDPNLPDSDSHGLTTGFGYDFNKNFTVDLAYSALIFEPRKIDNSVNSSFGGVDGRYKQIINMGILTFTYKF